MGWEWSPWKCQVCRLCNLIRNIAHMIVQKLLVVVEHWVPSLQVPVMYRGLELCQAMKRGAETTQQYIIDLCIAKSSLPPPSWQCRCFQPIHLPCSYFS